ncbi:MAG: site-2 protease family protein [Clostridia bacterium]
MRICTIRGTEIRLHPLMIVVVAGACVLGKLYDLLQIFFALSLHEAGHIMAAAAFGCRINSIELQPFGGVARLSNSTLSSHADWCIAATGPVTSFILAGATATVCYLSPMTGARMQAFLMFNLTLGIINLLPALPLDGGRIVKCALQCRTGMPFAVKTTAWTGIALGVGMLVAAGAAAFYDRYNLTLPVMGIFILIAAIHELRLLPDKKLATVWQHQTEIQQGGLDVHMIAAREGMRGMEALRLLKENRFNIIRVLDEHLSYAGELDERRLVLGIARLGTGASVGEILLFDRTNRLC